MTDGLKKDIMINRINTNTMKTKVTLLLVVLAVTFSGKALAQMDECITTVSLFIEPAKAKNYRAALTHYNKVMNECPKYNIATYQYAERMFKYFVENGDLSKLSDYEKNFDLQLANYPSKTKVGKNMAKVEVLFII